MPFSSGSVSFRRYHVTGQCPASIDQPFLDVLNGLCQPDELAGSEEVTSRFSGGRHIYDDQLTFADHVFNDCILFALRIDTNRIPAAIKAGLTAQAESAAAAANPSGFISKFQRRETRDQVKQELEALRKSGQYRRTRLIPILWDVPRAMIYTPAAGDTAAHLATLLEAAFGLELEGLSAGSLALRHLANIGKRAAYEDAQPSRFAAGPVIGVQPNYPWIAKGPQPKDFFGNEFLLWLWHLGEPTTGVMFDRSLQLDCAYGQTGQDTFRGDGPHNSIEARQALRSGKVPRRAGLIMQAAGNAFSLQLDAESLAISSLQLPKIEEAENPRQVTEARIDLLRDLCTALDTLYTRFILTNRFQCIWPDTLTAIRKWIQEANS